MAWSSAHDQRRATLSLIPLLLLALHALPAAADDPPAGPTVGRGAFSSGGGVLSDLLSAPLPGTQARADADLAARLQQTLLGFDGVNDARVLVTRVSPEPDAPSGVVVQLKLDPQFRPTPAWLDTLCIFSLRIIPDLDPDRLTIAASDGRTLLEAGESRLPEISTPRTPVLDETFRSGPWWLLAAAGAGFVLVSCGLLLHRLVRGEAGRQEARAADGPLEFLRDLPEERVARVLSQERPEVVAAVMALAPAGLAERLAARCELPAQLPRLAGPLGRPMVNALADALRRRLAE